MWYVPDNLPIGQRVDNVPDPDGEFGCCEYNTRLYCKNFGGVPVEGAYVLVHETLPIFQLVKHWVVQLANNELIDVTPFGDDRVHNWFTSSEINVPNIFIQSLLCVNTDTEQEIEQMFYVYCYKDSITSQPLYVGKGQQDRAYVHLKHATKTRKYKNTTRFLNKLESLIESNTPPEVVFLAQNIQDEEIAYQIEADYIKKYGRLGYDDGGILLNTCLDSRPPNHKGKTYKDIYGDRWEEQVEKRRQTQIQRGGFGPKQHSAETKEKFKQNMSGSNNHMFGKHHSAETKRKISEANKGRKHPQRSRPLLIIDHNTNTQYKLTQNELQDFCKRHNLSYSTLWLQIQDPARPYPKRGKTKGWQVKKNVDENRFKDFEL